ncbi:MAG: hypothetical protein QM582_15790 [Micropruina sp.]|uniref:hypothetical protein n=1 Tax=Micropruina sp. TaxID=2737536 RepID=UPI0039E66971
MEQILTVAVGFVLTTVIGGWWASRLQQRSWERQNELRLRENERSRAEDASRELSALLDRRLYRMLRVYWAIAGYDGTESAETGLTDCLAEYRAVLYEWNDRLNTNLALVSSHFGDETRSMLEAAYEDFRRVGGDLERAAGQVRQGRDASTLLDGLGPQFEGWEPGSLNNRVYRLCLAMMTQLRDGRVGRGSAAPWPDHE